MIDTQTRDLITLHFRPLFYKSPQLAVKLKHWQVKQKPSSQHRVFCEVMGYFGQQVNGQFLKLICCKQEKMGK